MSPGGRRNRLWPWVLCILLGLCGIAATVVWRDRVADPSGRQLPLIGVGFPALAGLALLIVGLAGSVLTLWRRWGGPDRD